MRRFLWGAALAACAASGALAQALPAEPGLLDGRTFAGETGKDGKKAGGTDELAFSGGRFHSKACGAYGFGSGEYSAREEAGAIFFRAWTESPRNGTIEWLGVLKDRTLTVNYRRRKVRPFWFDADKRFWFKGKQLVELKI